MIKADVIVIGAGVTGCSVARELSRYRLSVIVLDRAADIAEGASKANSGIVHAGYDAVPGSEKARYNVLGASMYPDLCRVLGVPYRQCGALVIGFSEQDRITLENLLERGKTNGVSGLELLGRADLLAMEPRLNQEVLYGLHVPSSGIVSPYELCYAMADDAALNGVSFRFCEEVTSISRTESRRLLIHTAEDDYLCDALINCAGTSSAWVHNQLSEQKLEMVFRRGQYYLLDRTQTPPFARTIFQCPSAMGKGVLVSPTVHGNVLLGPSAEDIPDPLDTATTRTGLDFVLNKARLTWPNVSTRTNITNFSGIRAHLTADDFVIGPIPGCPGAFDAAGIESPGLSSAPAVGKALAAMAADYLHAGIKSDIQPYQPMAVPFREMSPEEQAAAVLENPDYGNLVCRCEVVTEAEIRAAIRRPVGARTIDGIKRRTRAGMGRCQGGFCMPRVAAILADELGCPILEITKSGGKSTILSDTIGAFLKGGSEGD